MSSIRGNQSDSTSQPPFFVTKDTYIDGKSGQTVDSNAHFLRIGRGSDDTITQTLIENYDHQQLQQGHSVTSLKLCLYQYFAHANAAAIDPFQINLINEEWDMGITADTKPQIGEQIATIYFSETEGKQCFRFDSSQAEKIVNSHGIIISGGESSVEKERYLLSSEWTSRSLNVLTPANSEEYHPHWVVTSEFDPASRTPSISPSSNPNTTNASGQTIPKDPPPLNNQSSDDDNSFLEQVYKSPYLPLILACFTCTFIIIAGLLYLRRKIIVDKKNKIHEFDPKNESYDDIFSVHEEQLRDMFKAKQNNAPSPKGRLPKGIIKHRDRGILASKPSQPSYERTLNNSMISSKTMGSKRIGSKSISSDTMVSNIQIDGKKKKESKKNINNAKRNTDENLNRTTKQVSQRTQSKRHTNKSRDDDETSNIRFLQSNTSSLSASANGGSLATHEMLERVQEPCTLNKFCLRVVERKECDIDYVAPGVASVVDKQCATSNPT